MWFPDITEGRARRNAHKKGLLKREQQCVGRRIEGMRHKGQKEYEDEEQKKERKMGPKEREREKISQKRKK